MGCGSSKLIPDGEVIPARIRPLLRIRFLESRRRKNGSNLETGTLSKKVLLKDTELLDQEDNSTSKASTHLDNNNTKSVSSSSSPSGSTKCRTQNSLPAPAPPPPPPHDKHNANHSEEDLKTPYTDELKQHNDTQTSVALAFKDVNREDEGAENKKTGEEGMPVPDVEEARCIICPGSPSFRVYFIEEEEEEDDKASVELKDDADAGKDKKEDVSYKKSLSHDRIETTTCAKFGEAQESKVVKKGKKGRSCKRAITVSKKRQGGVKNLLNVKSCYHLSCSGNDRANLLARKAEA